MLAIEIGRKGRDVAWTDWPGGDELRHYTLGSSRGIDPHGKQILDFYRESVAFEKQLESAPLIGTAEGEYAGSDACGSCHAKALETWRGSAHAHAWSKLVETGDTRGSRMRDLPRGRFRARGWIRSEDDGADGRPVRSFATARVGNTSRSSCPRRVDTWATALATAATTSTTARSSSSRPTGRRSSTANESRGGYRRVTGRTPGDRSVRCLPPYLAHCPSFEENDASDPGLHYGRFPEGRR